MTRILVVDNERELLDLLELHLAEFGMRVSKAASGREALNLLHQYPFDLVILDILMDEMDGFEVLREIRQAKMKMPVILLSAKHELESKILREGHLDSLLQTIMADYVLILQDKGMEWHLDLPSKPVPAAFDHDGLSQAVRNLIDNAILHGGGGKYLGVRLIPEGDRVLIEIEDRGKGIPPHETERIFEPFYRVDRGRPSDGLGVGLTLADAIVRRHGGVLEVSSEPYVRNVFRIILPVGPAASVKEKMEGTQPPPRTGTIPDSPESS